MRRDGFVVVPPWRSVNAMMSVSPGPVWKRRDQFWASFSVNQISMVAWPFTGRKFAPKLTRSLWLPEVVLDIVHVSLFSSSAASPAGTAALPPSTASSQLPLNE